MINTFAGHPGYAGQNLKAGWVIVCRLPFKNLLISYKWLPV